MRKELVAVALFLALLYPVAAFAGKPTFVCFCVPPDIQNAQTSRASLRGIEEAMSAVDMLPYSQEASREIYQEFQGLYSSGLTKVTLKEFSRKHDVDMLLLYYPEVELQKTSGQMDIAKIRLTEKIIDGSDGTIIIEKRAFWPVKVNKGCQDIRENLIAIRAIGAAGKALTEAVMGADAMIIRYFY